VIVIFSRDAAEMIAGVFTSMKPFDISAFEISASSCASWCLDGVLTISFIDLSFRDIRSDRSFENAFSLSSTLSKVDVSLGSSPNSLSFWTCASVKSTLMSSPPALSWRETGGSNPASWALEAYWSQTVPRSIIDVPRDGSSNIRVLWTSG